MKKSSTVVLQEGAYYVISAPNGKVLEIADYNTENGAAVQLWDNAGQPWQQWTFVEAGDGAVRIQNRFTGKYMDLALGGTTAGTWVHQWSHTSASSQLWKLETTRSSRTRIRSVAADKCLDLVAMSTCNGTPAQIWNDVEGGSQEWHLTRVEAKDTQVQLPKEPPRKGPTQAQRKHSNDLVKIIGSAGRKENPKGGVKGGTKPTRRGKA